MSERALKSLRDHAPSKLLVAGSSPVGVAIPNLVQPGDTLKMGSASSQRTTPSRRFSPGSVDAAGHTSRFLGGPQPPAQVVEQPASGPARHAPALVDRVDREIEPVGLDQGEALETARRDVG